MPTTPDKQNDSRTRVLLATTELRMGGAEKCLVSLATGLDRERFAPTVVALMPPPESNRVPANPAVSADSSPAEDEWILLRQLEAAHVPVRFLNVKSLFSFPRAVSGMKKLLREIQPDIVHSFLFHANGLCGIATRSTEIGAHIAGIRVADPGRMRHRIEKLLCRRTSRFVCVSKSVEEFSRETAGLPAEKLLTIPNGIDLARVDQLQPARLNELGIADDRKVIVFVGRLHEQKGLVEFFEHLESLFAQLPDHDLLLVGDGPLREPLQNATERMRLTDRVHFAGWRSDAMNIVAASQLLVLPSRWEGMPNVLMEAMALGKPAVVFNVHGVAELMGDNDDAGKANAPRIQVCPPGKYAELIKNLVKIAQSTELRDNLGSWNRRRIQQQFSLSEMIEKHQDLYAELMNDREK